MEQSLPLLHSKINNQALLDQLKHQLNKDFYRAVNVEIVTSDATFLEIISSIEIELKKIVENNPSKLSVLLYLIDIQETEVHQNLKENPNQMIEVLTYLILKRECQKVYFKNKL